VREGLGDERFAVLTAAALEDFSERHAGQPEHPGGPLLAWWAGFAAFENGDLPAAERHFLRAVAAHGGYLNSWYYLFRAAYGQRAYDRALIALRSYWKQDPDGLAAMIEGQRELNLRILEYLVGWLIDPDQQVRERYREASVLAEMMTRAVPDEPRYWNNLGLFLRDYGDQLKLRVPAPAEGELDELWARAFAAYERTLELEPDHPAYINDTAVMLHYYLEEDFDRAEAMYLRAVERAEEELAGKGLSTSDRAWFETALKDAGDNLERLRAKRAALEPGS
jgi:tetratricopeptide (TPR) repeat protein